VDWTGKGEIYSINHEHVTKFFLFFLSPAVPSVNGLWGPSLCLLAKEFSAKKFSTFLLFAFMICEQIRFAIFRKKGDVGARERRETTFVRSRTCVLFIFGGVER
jgi:hypothetical protein